MGLNLFTVALPEWLKEMQHDLPFLLKSNIERVQLVNRLALENVARKTGGPFAAIVCEKDSGRLVSVGVNRVIDQNCSSAHAEVVALSLAQKTLGCFDLGGEGKPAHELIVNWMPCAMCFGALCWSGIRSLVVAGVGNELEAITGFDEGPLTPKWRQELSNRGISFIGNVDKSAAIKTFEAYMKSGQLVYNGHSSSATASSSS